MPSMLFNFNFNFQKASKKSKMISLFFERLEKNKAEIEETGCLPKELIGLISVEDLKRCYQFVIGRRHFLTQHFNDAALEDAQSYRLDKKYTQLPRTLNIIFDIEKRDLYLILETKRKKEGFNGQVVKQFNMQTFSGTSKTTKPAWRIDSEAPEKWANAVFYVGKSNPVAEKALLADSAKAVKEVMEVLDKMNAAS